MNLSKRNKYIFVGAVFVLALSHVLWDYFHGGVPEHYLLHRKDMPKFSNWWSVVTIPMFSCIALTVIRRKYQNEETGRTPIPKKVLYGFICAFLLGTLETVLFYTMEEFAGYPILSTFVVALFLPIHRVYFILGFVLGMTYGFGGVIPILAGVILMGIYVLEYEILRKGFLRLIRR
ncbi:MAG: hypothetical protein AB3N16_13285 [Flavobacteriaceae bacterium]